MLSGEPSHHRYLVFIALFKDTVVGAAEMGQWLRALSVLPEDLGLSVLPEDLSFILSSQIRVHTWFSKRKL